MAFVFDTTVKGSSANSYLSKALSEDMSYAHQYGDDWISDKTSQERYLVAASKRLDEELYNGSPTTDTQSLLFPRSGLYFDGNSLDEDAIPPKFLDAVFELALHYARQKAGDITIDTDAELFESKSESLDGLGSVSVTYKKNMKQDELPQKVRSLLQAMSSNGWTNDSLKIAR